MSNNFSKNLVKNKTQTPKNIGITDLLVDSGTDEIVTRAKSDGRYLSLPVTSFVPDPNQPRKTFDQQTLDALRESIEQNGQLQPILVGNRLPDGTYPIIAGERRWRAIRDSVSVKEVSAIIRGSNIDELSLIIMQIDENNQREQIPAVENAMAIKRVIDLCKQEGNDKIYAAKFLNISPSQLSKHLALLDASDMVSGLSIDGETQDVEALYSLSKAAESKPKEVAQLINQWRSGKLDTSLRKASQELASDAKLDKKKEKVNKKTGNLGKEKLINLKKASSVRLELKNDKLVLMIKVADKRLSYRLDAKTVVALKDDLTKMEV